MLPDNVVQLGGDHDQAANQVQAQQQDSSDSETPVKLGRARETLAQVVHDHQMHGLDTGRKCNRPRYEGPVRGAAMG
jgi:hypothetical protein